MPELRSRPQPDVSQDPETGRMVSAAVDAAAWMRWLAPGPLAELRRMDSGIGAPGFWRLAAKHPKTIGERADDWMGIVRILAVLTPKGEPALRPALHQSDRRLGAVLCDGGDREWSGPDPTFSERRLAQLLAARGRQRTVLLERTARMLAGNRAAESGVNVRDVAAALLDPDDARRLAEPYYQRLDRGEQATQRDEKEGAA